MAETAATKPPKDQTYSRTDWLIDRAVAGAIALGRALPARGQSRLADALARSLFTRQKEIADTQLGFIWPDLTPERRAEIAQGAVRNVILGTLEIADSRRLLRRAAQWAPQGPGLEALDAAKRDARPAVLVTGHFGNWEAARAALTCRGHEIGGLYRPLNNGYLDARWSAILSGLSGPVFPRGRQGLRGLLKYLRQGGAAVMLPDQYVADGPILDFLGQPAPTSLAAAELAMRFEAPLIPFYGIRRGGAFDVRLEAPVAPGEPAVMMQAVNDSLAARVSEAPDQWLWTHQRWKPGRVARRRRNEAAAVAGAL